MMESDLSLKEKEHWETDVGCLPVVTEVFVDPVWVDPPHN